MSRPSDAIQALRRRLRAGGRFLVIVAGPNGAGKSTFVDCYIKPSGLRIINPDDIARGLAPDAAEHAAYEAAEVADALRRKLIGDGVSFCMETVFSDPAGAKVQFLRDAQAQGYAMFLVFIGLESVALSVGRVMQRVEQGGHDVPDEKLEARFPRTFRNLRDALAFVDYALLMLIQPSPCAPTDYQ